MPKSITKILDPDRPRKKRKKRKRKVDYTELLAPPIVPVVQCPHTKRVQDASMCSQCTGVKPSIIHKPPTIDWWAVDDHLIDELDLDVDIDLDSLTADDDIGSE